VVHKAMADAGVTFADLDAVAVTGGPGLIGGVIVGVMTAKAIASVHQKPLVAVNHLEGHALTVRLTHDIPFPFLLLLASGGHCQFLIVRGVGQYERLGGTVDDALGEAFDKTAKLLGMDYPGGPAVEKAALSGNPKAFTFPVPMKGREGCDFSFSGLKTAVRLKAQEEELTPQRVADICASFQSTAGDSVCDRSINAMRAFRAAYPEGGHFVLAGGVAANQYLRGRLEVAAAAYGLPLIAPPIGLCTDNAAMIAWAGVERFRLGMVDNQGFEPKARWPLSA
ncbi:MAG: tRNA (adenosine(37)-N6)-threonylcarbamoyltransferase complex transferase subunit TsaD, partial [Rickettsiales bacterium]|nr:tRNA (adenosine(37)-N6)-threonylcarbamoyltransferase complex transferase subunit TsaD [Rickettsiales bacterium]